MDLTHRFTVPTDVETAWAAFNDLEDIAPCFPGAQLTDYDGTHLQGLVRVKLGPISLQYAGSGEFVERDEAAHRAVIDAKGRDKRGNGTAAAKVTLTLVADGSDATDVEVKTDLNVTGKPAQFGRGVMQDVSDKLLASFVSCLQQKFDGGSDDAPTPAQASSTASSPTASATLPGTTSSGADESGGSAAGSGASAGSATSGDQATAELDLGATVLPVLIKRYAPYLLGALGLLVVLKLLRGGSSDDDADVVIEVDD